MGAFNSNRVIFGGDKDTLKTVLMTMVENYAAAADNLAERGLEDSVIPLPQKRVTLKSIVNAIASNCWEPVCLLDPASKSHITSEDWDISLEKLDNGEEAVKLYFDTGIGTMGDLLEAFSQRLPQGDYAFASSWTPEDSDVTYINLGNWADNGPYACGPEPSDEERAYFQDDEGCTWDELEGWGKGDTTQDAVVRKFLGIKR